MALQKDRNVLGRTDQDQPHIVYHGPTPMPCVQCQQKEADNAALRTERDALRAENEKLRARCEAYHTALEANKKMVSFYAGTTVSLVQSLADAGLEADGLEAILPKHAALHAELKDAMTKLEDAVCPK